MNNLDKEYQMLLEYILGNGVVKKDRTGTGTVSVFGRQIRHKMSDGFPLLTTKKMSFKTIVTELLWFLRGDTNIKYLVDNGCNIWNGDAYKRYVTYWGNPIDPVNFELYTRLDLHPDKRLFTKEEFIERIKTIDEFAKTWGELGPIYGAQWRSWEGKGDYRLPDKVSDWVYTESGLPVTEYQPKRIDQIQNLINDLKSNPDSRRLMVNAWNVGELDQMVLPPCHYGFQVYTRELTASERITYKNTKQTNFLDSNELYDFIKSNVTMDLDNQVHKECDESNIPTRAISLMWNQRSVDTFLGLPFNIASYGLLLEIIAKEVNMIPDELIGNLGDVHLYSNHVEQAKEQIGRKYTHEERTELLKQSMGDENYNKAVSELVPFGGGMSEYYDLYKIPTHTREPFPLPSVTITERNWYQHQLVKEHLGEKTLDEKLKCYRPECFELIGYQSHPKIKAPLSN